MAVPAELQHRLETGSESDIADTLTRLEQFPMTQAAMLKTGIADIVFNQCFRSPWAKDSSRAITLHTRWKSMYAMAASDRSGNRHRCGGG